MTPQFRQAIFQLPLCEGGSLDTPSGFLSGSRRQMIFNLQRLFVLL
jgi:ubiquitin carboxyl-terminal hydrolase 40